MPRFRTAAVVALLVTPIVAGGFLLQSAPAHATARLFDQVESLVARQYVDSLSEAQVYERAAHGLVRELNDPYSELLSPRQSEEFNRGTGGRYGGTGMLLEQQKDAVVVSRVFPHTPAEDAGVMEGDRIIGIDDSSAVTWQINKISERLRGEPGSTVAVSYARPGVPEPIKLRFTRRLVRVPAVVFTTMLDDHTGYIPLQTFNENAADEVESAVDSLEKQGARGIVLDMRDNGGGIVEQALAVSSLFLTEGQEIVSVRSRNTGDGHDVETARSHGQHIATSIPLVVLIDGSSASATEIVAGALQDHDRALVVGTTSFGKGLVQSVFSLDGGYSLKMTTGKWYTPSGRSIHRERKLLEDGTLEEVKPDSGDTTKRVRPRFKSDAGRTVYGGGGITPDVTVPDDTLSTQEQQFLRSIAPKAQIVQTVLSRYALELKSEVTPGFAGKPEWGRELDRRLAAAGVVIDPKYAAVAPPLLQRQLELRVARQAFGDAAAKKRDLARDHQLMKALDLLHHAATEQDLFAQTSASR